MTFHRLTLPTYFIAGGAPLLAGYDRINHPTDPSVGGSGSDAPADGKKAGGANDGTYFVGFEDAATASNVNRPAAALAANTDVLDDILHTSIPTIFFADATAPGGGTTSIALTGEIYVGKSGATNDQNQRNRLVHITDQSNNDLEVGGNKIEATLIHNGSNVNVVGTQASGFRTNATVTVSPAIPAATAYRVWYGVRNSLANISLVDKGPLIEEQIRSGIEHVPALLRSLFRQIHSEASVNQAYDAGFDSTIRSLASAGLNERYRRATTQPAGFSTGQYNSPGDGAIIIRDGKAVEIKTAVIDLTTDLYPDPQLAAFRVSPNIGSRSVLSAYSSTKGGDIGFYHESESVLQSFTVEAIRDTVTGPALLEVIPRDIRAATAGGDAVLTFINPLANATLNPDSLGTSTGRATIQCAAGQYFRTGGNTAVRLDIDLIEVTYSGRTPETYKIEQFTSDTRILVRRLNGKNTNIFPAAATTCTIRWLAVATLVGGSGQSNLNVGIYGGRRFMVFQPAPLTNGSFAHQNYPLAPGFFAAFSDPITRFQAATALAWGHADPTSSALRPVETGQLNGDGTIFATGMTLSGALASLSGPLVLSSAVTMASTLVVATSINTTSGDIQAGDDLVAGDDVIAGDRVAAGGLVSGLSSYDTQPEFYYKFREDFIRLIQTSSPNLITTLDHVWEYNPILSTYSMGLAGVSAKNPGALAVTGAGSGVHRQLSIYTSDRNTFGFANLDALTLVLLVTDDPANVGSDFRVGFVQDETTTVGGTDTLRVSYSALTQDWRLLHRKSNANGANNGFVLGAYVSGVYNTVRFVKSGSDIEVYFNGVLKTTVLAANVPVGSCTFNLYFENDSGDSGASEYLCDLVDFRFTTGANRNGAP